MATDKMPWWKENPISLRGSQVKQVEVDGKPSLASEFRAAAYEHDDSGDEVIIFCLTYQQRDDALDEMRRFNNELPKTDLVGFSRASDRVIVILSAPEDCPDREFFVGHFATVAVPAQTGATPAAVRE